MLKALLEIGCEEIPARFMPGFLTELKEKAQEILKREGLAFSAVETLGTCRRLALFIEGLPQKQDDLSTDFKGPPANAAFDPSGKPTRAAEGFAKSQGVTVESLKVRDNYVFARTFRKGRATENILSDVFPEIISSIYQPLAMRWGSLDYKFIRPIHWITALCGNKVVKFELAGIKAGNKTSPHRYKKNPKSPSTTLGTSKIPNPNKEDYIKLMRRLGVIADQDERKEMIRKMVVSAAKKAKAEALVEEDLLNEVTFLVENPVVYVGSFNKEFLEIPQEVLITSMQKNQKYFPMTDSSGKLAAKFAVVTDGCRSKDVVDGNEKVLSARLSDAKFFFEEDKKQPLKLRVPDLARVGFFEKLGSMADKSQRIARLGEWMGKRVGFDGEGEKNIKRIAELCKADLTTKMVYEFPVLQGVIGKYYALLSGEDPRVAEGILEHYLPRYAEDRIPASMEGTIVALADRIDSIVGCFAIGSIPSGSADPYGLRRAAHGIIRIISEKKIDLLMDEVIDHSYALYRPLLKSENNLPKIKAEILAFIAARMKPVLLEKGIRYDVVDAALANFNDILDSGMKAEVINRSVNEKWFPGVVVSADRVCRIAGQPPRAEVIEEDLVDNEEKELFNLYMKLNWEVGEAVKKEEWGKALKALALLTDPLELFFDKVLVMHKEERLKLNRLALLKSIERLYLSVADFRKIVLPG